ncbi:MAG TPA: xanthine dehydrogenase family protein subunit M [Gaiellaceae bacterium]|nr:xanthine dehydrogenase family protein subunit M [Gaiellaceae bacterium]
MIPASFDYELAGSVQEAIELLGSREDAKLLAGGHSLIPAMKLRIARPGTLVDIGRIGDLSYVREDGDAIAIGALTRHHDVAANDLLRERCGIVACAAAEIGDPQVRHFGTIGGSVSHGDPASDMPGVLLTLDAEFVAVGPDGERRIPAAEFFTGVFETALGPQDVLTEIRVPAISGGWSYQKFARRKQDWATVAVAAVASNGGAKVGLVSMGGTPLRAKAVEEALAGGADPAAAAEHADEGTEPSSDVAGSADYRRHLVRVLTKRALEHALKS